MTTQKLIGTAGLAGALVAGLLSQQAVAADELVVKAVATKAAVAGESQQVFRDSTQEYIRAFNEQLRTTIEADLKRQLAPKVEVAASAATPTRG